MDCVMAGSVMETPDTSFLSIAVLVVAVLASLTVCYIAFFVLARINRRLPIAVLNAALQELREPALLLVPAITSAMTLSLIDIGHKFRNLTSHVLEILIIIGIAWLCLRGFDVWRRLLLLRYRLDVSDNLHARQIHTQVQMLRRIAAVVIGFVGVAAILMTFPQVRAIGTTLFASAGVAGLVVGIAARPAIGNLLAGLQVALTEPIRMDDVVVVEGEWGRIEEIRTSYVVVRTWDLRRLILPLTYFIEKPFQNWTRRTADLLGTVFIYMDYSVPVETLRTELRNLLEGTKLWDGKVWNLQVTDATAQTLELRALVSAANSDNLWDLRCLVREKLVAYLKEHHPQALPHMRVHVDEPTSRR